MKAFICGIVGLLLQGLAVEGVAHAEELADTSSGPASTSARDVLGANYSTALHGPLSGGRATVFMSGGWDTALDRARADIDGWLHLYGPLSLTLGAAHGASDAWRPSAGLAFAFWRPEAHGP